MRVLIIAIVVLSVPSPETLYQVGVEASFATTNNVLWRFLTPGAAADSFWRTRFGPPGPSSAPYSCGTNTINYNVLWPNASYVATSALAINETELGQYVVTPNGGKNGCGSKRRRLGSKGRGLGAQVRMRSSFETRSASMARRHICIKEVPMSTLFKQEWLIRVGNASNPLIRMKVCCDGYQRNPHNFRKCDPVCKPECVNGCVAPNVCKYSRNHVLDLLIPTYPNGCDNCRSQPNRSYECKPGYILEPTKKFCIPLCRSGCPNGMCTEPNICQCNIGYERDAKGSCVPKCVSCDNGRCTVSGICACLPGFTWKINKCVPVCDRGCEGGLCTAPNVCSCGRGFTLVKTGTKDVCNADCDPPCLNGICNGHNICECNPGYIPDVTNSTLCQPHCANGCPNGVCARPNFCICDLGFVRDRRVKGSQNCVPRGT